MEAVLEAATVLSVCKMLCSLPFLCSVSRCRPLSFCCCCLLLFTDVALTVFLGVLLVLDLWKEGPSAGDIIALRSLLFVSHTYGVVFVLTLPALIVDSLVKLLQEENPPLLREKNLLPLGEKNPLPMGNKNPPLGDKNPLPVGGKNLLPLGNKNPQLLAEESVLRYDVGAYLCCLFLWTFGSLSVRWRWRLEEVVTAACVFSTDSLLFCLPNVLTLTFLRLGNVVLLAVAALLGAFLLSRTWTTMLFKPHPGGAVVIPNCCEVKKFPKRNMKLSEENRLQENNSETEKVIPLTEQRWTEGGSSRRGGPCPRACPGGRASRRSGACPWSSPWADVLIGGGCLLILLLLPLNLSVNVPLFVSVDKVLQHSLKDVRFSEDAPCHDMDIV